MFQILMNVGIDLESVITGNATISKDRSSACVATVTH